MSIVWMVLGKIGSFFLSIFGWFFKLDLSIQLIVFLCVSIALNAWQYKLKHDATEAHVVEINKLKGSFADKEIAEENKAVEVFEDRQNIWDLFVENARIENDTRLTALRKENVEVNKTHVELKVQNPLPVTCKLPPSIVHHTNEAVRKLIDKEI